METYLGDLARYQDKEVYIITGPAGSKGTIKNEGIITIPTSVWKVAVIMPRNQGLEHIDDLSDFEVIAVIAPNDAGVRNVSWETWKTTVDAVEALTGYDLLALLADQIEIAAESNTKPPMAAVDGPYTGAEGSPITMSGSTSTDPDGDALTYRWVFGDGGSATGESVSHSYAQNASYTVHLIATDVRGLIDTATTTATVSNVAPTIAPFSGATLEPTERYTAAGSFTDPGADVWTGTVDYGDGSVSALTLTGKTFSLSHDYRAPGTYSVTVRISDGDDTSARTQTVVVLTTAQVIANTISRVERLRADGTISGGNGNALLSHLRAAQSKVDHANPQPMTSQLRSALHQLDLMERKGDITPAAAAPLRTSINRILASMEG